MKTFLLTLSLSAVTLASSAQESETRWMRYPALSPDGTTIAFTYQGDLYTVPATGGRATQLTTHAAHDTQPRWSPDGQHIAFASDRLGSFDVYVVSREGGAPLRLTTHSGSEKPLAWQDKEHVLFESNVMPTAQSIQFFSRSFPQVYRVDLKGSRPELFSTLPMQDIHLSSDGQQLLYHDSKGYEDPWRKHHTSSITRDVWLASRNAQGAWLHRQLTHFAGEDRNPVWTPDHKAFYYLTEENGTFNIARRGLNEEKSSLITTFKQHPVRFLTSSTSGLLCFGHDGSIYTLQPGGQPQRVSIDLRNDQTERAMTQLLRSQGATEVAVAPGEKEIAFVLHGDVYVTSTSYTTTRRITNTPEQERNITFAPDGRSIAYASERNGLWQIYQTSLVRKDEKQFAYATSLKEEQLIKSAHTSFQPQYSPNGKELAFLENRTTLRVLNLRSKQVRTVMEGKYEYSYSDGDQHFSWSPDSRYLLTGYIGTGGWNNKDIALVHASGQKPIVNLTESGYVERDAQWVLDGKAMLYTSDRAGYRSHGSWGAERDYYLMFFDLDAYERFHMNKEELALADAAKAEEAKRKAAAAQAATAKNKKNKKNKTKTATPDSTAAPQRLDLDLEHRFDRIVRLTPTSTQLGDAVLAHDGSKLYYLAAFEGGFDLWEQNLRERGSRVVAKGIGYGMLTADKKTDHLFFASSNSLKKLNTKSFAQEAINYEAQFDHRPAQERAYIFDHAWQQVKDKFYKSDLHQTDWDFYRQSYRRFLPSINNNYDFAELLSEMLGELNASHTGARYSGRGGAMSTAALGLFFDEQHQGKGLRIAEVLARGPFATRNTGVKAGDILEHIEGTPLEAGADYYPLLEGKTGRPLRVGVLTPSTGKRREVTVRPISAGQQADLLYKRWVKRNRAMVDSLSGGRLAYVHVQGMNSESFREVYSELLSDANRQKLAVIVDTRHNGGGWLHDDLITLLTGKEYQQFVPRGQYIGSDPFAKWVKPSCLLVCEDNYSNASGFPSLYKDLNIGPIIGAPIPGTMTAVWWETQMDRSLIFGIPQVGVRDMQGRYGENLQLTPDYVVYNTPEEVATGRDRQIETAVQVMLQKVGVKP